MAVADSTGQLWLSGFNDVGVALFGISGDELHSLRVSPFICSSWRDLEFPQEGDESKANHIIQKAICNIYNFTCRAAQQTFNVRESSQLYLPKISLIYLIYRTKTAYGTVFRKCNLLITLSSPRLSLLSSQLYVHVSEIR
jgi:hypothetical protein